MEQFGYWLGKQIWLVWEYGQKLTNSSDLFKGRNYISLKFLNLELLKVNLLNYQIEGYFLMIEVLIIFSKNVHF